MATRSFATTRYSRLGALLGLVLTSAWGAAEAQTVCRTSNCAGGGALPAGCNNRSAPSTAVVLMTTSGINFIFSPAEPRIEPGDCIEWRAATATHDSTSDPCTDDPTCALPPVPACLWDSGNIDSLSATPSATCYYDPVTYPATTGDGFYCRLHDNPAHTGTMHGTLRVTTPIQLRVNKDLGLGHVTLVWSGGGVPPDVTYKVVRNNVGNPLFPKATNITVNPDGGVAGTQYTDVGELANPSNRYYLVRNKQTNE